jgi:hypothetical protein
MTGSSFNNDTRRPEESLAWIVGREGIFRKFPLRVIPRRQRGREDEGNPGIEKRSAASGKVTTDDRKRELWGERQ